MRKNGMPGTTSYECKNCGQTFTETGRTFGFITLKKTRCPNCGSRNVQRADLGFFNNVGKVLGFSVDDAVFED